MRFERGVERGDPGEGQAPEGDEGELDDCQRDGLGEGVEDLAGGGVG